MSRYDDIIAALQLRFSQIRVTPYIEVGYSLGDYVDNIFQTDAGANSFLNLEYQTAPPEKPCTIVYTGDVTDTLDGDTPPSLGEENHFFEIKVEGFINDSAAGSEGQKLRQDFIHAINQDRTFGGLVEGVEGAIKSSTTVEPAGEGGFLSFVEIHFTLFYATIWGAY